MQPKVKRILIPTLTKLLFVITAFFVLWGCTKFVLWGQSFMRETGLTPMTVYRLLIGKGIDLPSQDGRTNILLLGVGGGTHDGSDLTDTILVLSLDTHKKSMAMISVPRDLWSETLKDKVNSAYHYGEEKKKDGGLTLAKVIVEDMVGLSISKALLIDFSGFEEVIDAVGGIDIDVDQGFVDPQFPIAGKENDDCGGSDPTFSCRYEAVTFLPGLQHMNGERALIYVRSRHAQGDEGSDFARGRRQQEVFVALLQQLKKPMLWVSPPRVQALLGAFDRATITDMRIGEIATIGKLMTAMGVGGSRRISFVNLLYEPPLWMYGRYTLVPKEDFPAIHSFIRSQLEQ